ncbi:MAG: hypothetical protein KDA37_18280 [Planctomycetales bacterium]|nr:hypothetical protein [Planctomycetales bacterium]
MLSYKAARVAERARNLYDRDLRDSLEELHQGRYVCIEPDSGDFFLSDTFDGAVNQAIDAYPERLTHTLRVGHSAAFHLGGASQ